MTNAATSTNSKSAFTSSTCEVECSATDARMAEARRKVAELGTVDLTAYDVIVCNTSAGRRAGCAGPRHRSAL